MPAGLLVLDESGNVRLDMNRRMTTIFGSFWIPVKAEPYGNIGLAGTGRSGSISDSRFSMGVPVWIPIFDTRFRFDAVGFSGLTLNRNNSNFNPPDIWMEGNTLRWQYTDISTRAHGDVNYFTTGGCNIFYGVC